MKDAAHTHTLIDGRAVAERLRAECAAYCAATPGMGRLVSVSVGDVPEVAVYVRNQARAAEKVGLEFDQQFWPADITHEERPVVA